VDLQFLEEMAKKYMGKRQTHNSREKGFVFNHGRRTGLLARNLRPYVDENGSFDDLIYIAGLYHDIGKGIEPHAWSGEILAREILKDHLGKKELEVVLEIISKHNTIIHGDQHPFYVKLIQDADLLDHMGTLEVWSKFGYSFRRGESIEDTLKYWAGGFYQEQLVKWRNRLNYKQAKKIFNERMEFLDQFIKRLEKENNGEIINKGELKNASE